LVALTWSPVVLQAQNIVAAAKIKHLYMVLVRLSFICGKNANNII
jgi:hypothetical protein